ncbi:DUF2141 domain-containing protein [Novosphingobium sp. H3SJ31-1]|uniref:DUF2141 domain-containing protein n=1 Tax=Novosphingobium album (ex Liu et al. 2023) TaxID=3031130 RepID=A0ABT5WV81_9SPHN|nr:DUF2141 domain-containing protein [Novosphingobium album (ex Liu et al. 2023)]MDE8653814.1 DUF2141 domain-containing protein [Novosphingobium album (ex Liu et al. 2023)]
MALGAGGGTGAGDVSVSVTGLRSTRGQVLACLTARPKAFPGCAGDPAAHTLIVPAGSHVELDFGAIPNGRYAISLVHDENANGRLDKRLMMPREGFGFSRDAPVRFGPPSFASAAFAVDGAQAHLSIRMRYLF